MPCLVPEGNDAIRLRYYLRHGEFNNPDVVEKLRHHPNADRLMKYIDAESAWQAPDFGDMGCVIETGQQLLENNSSMFVPSIHATLFD
jgi:hypothetical protein